MPLIALTGLKSSQRYLFTGYLKAKKREADGLLQFVETIGIQAMRAGFVVVS